MQKHQLGLWSGMGMVVANMVGAGVFVSGGSMVDQLSPGYIMLAWAAGVLIALSGARAYAGIVEIVPYSGGEYRILSALIHPALGYLAGWASLLIGFSAPIAISAGAVGAFALTIYPGANAPAVAALVIAALTAAHAVGLRFSVAAQNALVAVKVTLIAGFVAIGLWGGNNAWPQWTAIQGGGFSLRAFMLSLFYVVFAFSGWNAAIYAASEFKNPRRDVARAMVAGCLVVGVLYLFINWIFIANLPPAEQAGIAAAYYGEAVSITLGHRIMSNILGPGGAACMSVMVIVLFISSASSMTFLGPRVYAEMAKDGFLPSGLKAKDGEPPVGAVLLQGVIALFLVFAYSVKDMLANVGAILTLFSALSVLSLLRVYFNRQKYQRPSIVTMIAAVFYLIACSVMLYFGFSASPTLNIWGATCILATLAGYFLCRKKALCKADTL